MPPSQLLKGSSDELPAELRLILNAFGGGLCGLDAKGNVTFCNDALLRMTGYCTGELIGNSLHELVHHSRPDGTKYPAAECAFEKAIYSHKAIHMLGEFLWRKDGTRFPAEYWAYPLQQPSSTTAYVITLQDLTEIQRAKDVLRQSEEKFRRILAGMPDVAWTSDRDGRTMYISPKVEVVFGYTKQEICAGGANLWIGRIHPEDFGRVNRAYKALFENQRPYDEEYRIRRKDDVWIWVHDRAMGTREENGAVYADGFLSDITRRKQAEAELQSKTAFLEAQADSTIDGILVVDARGQKLMQNRRLVEIFNIPPKIMAEKDDQPMLKHVVSIVKEPDPFLAKVHHLYENPGETSRDEIELKDGRILDRYSAPVIDKDRKCYGRIWAFRDITERKRNEDTLQQLSMAVEQSPASVIITDPHGNISYVNRKFTECTGYRPEEVLGKNPRILKSGRTSPDVYRSLWSTIKQGHEWHGELCNKKKNGELYWEAATIRPITGAKGAITHYLALKEDITERRRAEEALKASEKRYRLLFERNLAGVLRTTMEGRVLDCNQATARMFGYDSPEEVLMLPVLSFYHQSSDREAFLTKLKSEKSVTNHEMRFRRKDGDSFWAIVNLSLVDDDSSVGGIIEGTLVDITERKRAEEELYGSRQMLRSILDAIPQRVFWKDRNSIYLGCNRAFATDAGVEAPAAIIGKSDFDLAWNQMADAYRADDKLVMEQGLPRLNFQERQSRPDGSVLWLQTSKLPLRDRQGKVTGVLGTYEDITERKEAEKELRLTQFSLEHASDAVEWVDPEARIVFVNEAACRFLGRSREELLSLSIPDINPFFSMEVWRKFWSEIKIRGSMTFESQHKAKQGRIFPVEITANYLEFDGQEYCFAFVSDITERKRAEGELRLTKFSMENASDAVEWIDSEARIVYVNQAECRALGRSREEILSLSIPDIDPLFPKDVWRTFWEQLKARGSMTFETQHKSKQGRVFPVEVTANYLEFDGQEYCFAFARDITDRRALESQLRHAQKLEGIGQLAAGIAHEINTPIQFVADNLTFLRDSWKSTHELLELYRSAIQNAAAMTLLPDVVAALKQAEQKCDLDFIVAEVPRAIDQGLEGAHRVAEIVRAMKEFSHPDSADKTATDLNKAIESTITVARNEWKYAAEVTTDLDENLPPVVCYPGDINQVILNLVVNAAHAIKGKVKDGEKGRITVCTRTRGEFAEISIADTGTGIPEAIRTRVFDPFFTTKEVGKGTGQGLSLAHGVVVKKHSGKIWFETEMGQGTTFFIHLPIKPAEHAKEN